MGILSFLLHQGANPNHHLQYSVRPLHFVAVSKAFVFAREEKLLGAKVNPNGFDLNELQRFSSPNLECKDYTALPGSKKKKEKAENPNNEVFSATDQLPAPIMESASNVEPFNLKLPVSLTKYKWLPISKRWRDNLMKLQSTDESEVTRIGSMIYIYKAEFLIAKGSEGTEVYLGLRWKDGTELAIKRVPEYNYHVLKNEERILRLPELYDAHIVRYIDYEEDEKFSYLCLQLCEYTLEEYIKIMDGDQKDLAFQILDSLKALHCQNPPILHGDLKPEDILIDVNEKVRLADFGKSTRLPTGETTLHTGSVKTDIQMAGMLIYYIFTRGHHPFGDVPCDDIHEGKYNLVHVKDMMAKELIKMMIDADPQKRPKVEECLNHPLFWSTERRVNYLKEVGNRKEVERCGKADAKFISSMNKCVGVGSFTQWKEKFPSDLVKKLEDWKKSSYPDNMLGLLRFARNVYQHHPIEAAKVDLLSMFPCLFECAYVFAESQGWNSEPLLKQMLITSNGSTASDGETATNSDEHLTFPVQESQPVSPGAAAE